METSAALLNSAGRDTVRGVSESRSRFEPSEPLTVTEVASEETSDGQREWCFSVKGLDETVQAARFATRREAERAHQRFKRAIELLGRPT
jgi:hypothetical protein